jgi:hypothetical protein
MPVSTHLTIEELAESISIVVNEIERYYEYYYCPKDFKDFNPSISEDNFKILQKCINLIPHDRNTRVSRLAFISFYYLVVVSEYYVKIRPRNINFRYELEEYNRMFMDVSFSNEEWASNIRRLVYKFD